MLAKKREYLAITGARKLKLKKMSGYNTEIEHSGLMFHVQTQDQGANAHYVESIVYRSGKVLASRRTYYTNFLDHPTLMDKINKIIEEQHESVLKDIDKGKFDHL